MSKDYYKILGITEFETAENIKDAYRKLARKWHPDVAGNTADALKHFKDINEAYEILSNKTKKEEYDRARRFYNYAKQQHNNQEQTQKKAETHNENFSKKNFSLNWEDFISGLRREKTYKESQNQTKIKGENIYSDVEISVYEAITGITKTVNMLQTTVCEHCKGRKFVNGSICQHCSGKGVKTDYKKFTVKIPAGIKNNSKIRLAGEGSKGKNGGENGDLYITVHIKENINFKTDGLNILKTIPISPYEAVLGTNLKVTTQNGNVVVKIAPQTQNGQKIRLSKCGLVQNNQIGDMIITVEIQIPKNISAEEIELYRKLEELSINNLRENFYDR